MTATETDIELIERLDFTPALPCEHSTHAGLHVRDESATWVQTCRCPRCGYKSKILICDSGRQVMLAQPGFIHYDGCGRASPRTEWDLLYRPIPEVQ